METVLIERDAHSAPHESKGIGESSNIPVAGVIAQAVFDAMGVRVTEAEELEGLDISEHSLPAYGDD